MTPPAPLSTETRKVLSNLELLIAAKKVGVGEVERQLGISRGTLYRLFTGKITLKFQTVLDVLQVLDVSPKAFFREVFGDETSNGTDHLATSVRTLAFPDPSSGVQVFTRTDLKRMIEEVLTERSPAPAAAPLDGLPEEDDESPPPGRTPGKKA